MKNIKIQEALEEGWTKEECEKGYGIFESNFANRAKHIEKIDCLEMFEDDFQAAKQAEKDGIKLIKNLPKDWEYSCVPFIDTKENRKKIEECLKKKD